MKERKLDFLSRRPVRAIILVSTKENERLAASCLPDEYLLDNGQFRFPAGYWESYFVNGKEYNAEGNRSLEEQKELIVQDLAEEGFKREEAEEFIGKIEIKEGRPMLLTPEASNRWLSYHPEVEKEALRLLDKAMKETWGEIKSEYSRQVKKR